MTHHEIIEEVVDFLEWARSQPDGFHLDRPNCTRLLSSLCELTEVLAGILSKSSLARHRLRDVIEQLDCALEDPGDFVLDHSGIDQIHTGILEVQDRLWAEIESDVDDEEKP